jgi:hypothetical protein
LLAKAAEMRSMQYWFRDVCAASADEHGNHGRLRATLFDALVNVDQICRAGGRHLTAAAAEQLAVQMERSLLAFNALAASAAEAESLLWKCIPKLHALTHIAYDSHGVNPRSVHCYADEDMVGRMKRIYLKCHGASAPKRALQRYIMLVGVRWHRHARPRPDRPAVKVPRGFRRKLKRKRSGAPWP